jgi:hypothetical protein
MDGRIKRCLLAGLTLAASLLACGFPKEDKIPGPQKTVLAATIFVMQTEVSTLETPAPLDTATFTPVVTATSTFTPFPTPQNPLVIRDTLCWLGPGQRYQVSSSLHAGTRVILLGQGSIPGWWVVEGPVYHDPCWTPQQDLQIDIGYDLSGLPSYDPPPTPKPRATKGP